MPGAALPSGTDSACRSVRAACCNSIIRLPIFQMTMTISWQSTKLPPLAGMPSAAPASFRVSAPGAGERKLRKLPSRMRPMVSNLSLTAAVIGVRYI